MDRKSFVSWELASTDTIDVKRCYIDMAGDLVAGVLLSQIIYWNLPSNCKGQDKLHIEREGQSWLVKSRKDWWRECRITPKQFDRAISHLEGLGIVNCRVWKFKGTPTKHISLNWTEFLASLEKAVEGGQRENGSSPKGKMEIDQRVKSKLPKGQYPRSTKTTTENTNIDSMSANTDMLVLTPEGEIEDRKKTDTYHGRDYAEGGAQHGKHRTDAEHIHSYYLGQMYTRHKIDLSIRGSAFAQRLRQVKSILQHFESVEDAKEYVDWFLNDKDFFRKQGYAFPLLVTDSVVEKYLAVRTVKPGMGDHLARGVASNEQERVHGRPARKL